jgi:hypothetical protein
MFPPAHVVGCSTGGQIRNDDVTDDEVAAVSLAKLTALLEPYQERLAKTA